jgi:hypothetical protein
MAALLLARSRTALQVSGANIMMHVATRKETRGFQRVDPGRMQQIGFWERAIRKIVPGFKVQFRRGHSGELTSAEIIGDPLGVATPGRALRVRTVDSFAELYRAMRSLAIYYQVGEPWKKPAEPPPGWLPREAQRFWERAANLELEHEDHGTYVKHYGAPLYIEYVDETGLRVTKKTHMQLIWVHAQPDGYTELSPFHYLPQEWASGDPLKERVAREWNKDMYCYIEEQLLRPAVARQKLAGVNAELHKQLIMAFFGTPIQGIGGVKGTAALVSSIAEMSADLKVWYKGYIDAKH